MVALPVIRPLVHHVFAKLLCAPAMSLSAGNRQGSGPGVPPDFFLPGFSVRTKESHFHGQGLEADHLVLSDPTVFSLSPAFPLLMFIPPTEDCSLADFWPLVSWEVFPTPLS